MTGSFLSLFYSFSVDVYVWVSYFDLCTWVGMGGSVSMEMDCINGRLLVINSFNC